MIKHDYRREEEREKRLHRQMSLFSAPVALQVGFAGFGAGDDCLLAS